MPNTAQDRARIAAKQKHEVYSIQAKYKIATKDIRAAMKVAKQGQPTTSRKLIYAELIRMEVPGHEKLPSYKPAQDKNWQDELNAKKDNV